MNASKNKILLVLSGLLITSTPVSAHISTDTYAGELTNLIAAGIVVVSIGIYLMLSNREKE